ncbi:MAG: thiamine pyrophosphate-binding protein [Rhodovibrio sp.]|nr:thiamine pyrophosphate-binding protein [Rhodovibrio sp.]
MPGVHTVPLYAGLAGSGVRHVTPRHEQGAGFMADGYARVTGRPACCFVIAGPGLTNIATAMAQAYGDSIPMLVISTVTDRRHQGRGLGQLHELPDQDHAGTQLHRVQPDPARSRRSARDPGARVRRIRCRPAAPRAHPDPARPMV